MTSKLKTYSKYKDSEIEWIGKIEKDFEEVTAEIRNF